MITVFGEGRGFRVVWLLEEMGLAYRLRSVDLLAGVEHDPEYLAINPAGFIPAIQDGDVTMVESIAIASAVEIEAGSFTNHSDFTRALPAYPPCWVSPSPQPFSTTRSPGLKSPLTELSTTPAKSIPAVIGHTRTTGALPVSASPSL